MLPELAPHFSQSGNPLFCHEDFLSQLEANRANGVGKRAALLLQRLLLDERREFFKSTQGVNKGWRRSRLGGNHGSHFYAWWAPRGASPLDANDSFEAAPQGSIFLRAIRHHDDHAPLDPQRFEQFYVPIGAADVRDESMVPAPWTPQQSKFASARQHVKTLRGFPGSGKTTALWHAAEMAGREAVLYVTYSRDLAILAQDYFAKMVPDHKRFRVVTFPELLRLTGGGQETPEPVRAARARFLKEIAAMSPRILGPWNDFKSALYDEMHAHLIGSAIPEALGRWPVSGRRLSTKDYRALRERSIGRAAADAALETADALDKRLGQPIEDVFFPELALARKGLDRLRGPHSGWLTNAGLSGYDCIALDEAQDLTPLEALLLIELAIRNKATPGARNTFLAAGDEAQTVRPTDFDWGWFHDLLHHKLASPTDFELRANLRSPQRIAEIINRVWILYGHLAKQERPSGSSKAELDDEAGDQVVFCTARPGDELNELLSAFSTREGLAIVNLADTIPAWVPEEVRPHLVTAADVKGLDFHSVCVLNGGEFLNSITGDRALRNAVGVGDLTKRLAIDQLRVAVSRPAERLYWLDVDPTGSALKASRELIARSTMDVPQPVVPAVLLKSLEEEALATEERIKLCEADARQFLGVKPDIAWSRANQAVGLLGAMYDPNAVKDPALRRSAHMTCAEIAFCLAYRKVKLSPQLGNPDLYQAAIDHARAGGRESLEELFQAFRLNRGHDVLDAYMGVRAISHQASLDPWLRIELQTAAEQWAAQAEVVAGRGDLAWGFAESFAKFCELFEFPDAQERSRRVRLLAVETLLKAGEAKDALSILEHVPDADPRLRARCMEQTGGLAEAAAIYLDAGASEDALRCYRNIPDFEKALEVASTIGSSPAGESLLWLDQMRKLVASRPANFSKVVLPAEKKLLEEMLENALGTTRRKPAAKKPAVPKKKVVAAAVKRKAARDDLF